MRYAFNIFDFTAAEILIRLSQETQTPIILQISEKIAKAKSPQLWQQMIATLRSYYQADVWLHLDHGRDPNFIRACIEAKWDMVMFDGSALPFDQNLIKTQELAAYAHAHGVKIEAELGQIGNQQDEERVSAMKLSLIQDFAEQTRIDYLALPFGNKHGRAHHLTINFKFMNKVQQAIPTALVLHGGSYLPKRVISQAVALGVQKVNISTELKQAYFRALRASRTATFETYAQKVYRFEEMLTTELKKLFMEKIGYLL